MKKYVLILTFIFGLSLASCGSIDKGNEDTMTTVSPATPSIINLDKFSYKVDNKEQGSLIVDYLGSCTKSSSDNENDSEKKGFTSLYTESKDKSIKDFLKENTFVSISQVMTNSDSSENVYNSVTYNIDLSLKNGVSYFEVQSGVGSNKEFEYHANDTVNDLHYIRKDGIWYEASGKTKVLNWNITDFSNVFDVYKFLTSSFEVPIGTNGVVSGDYEYYSIVTKASDSSISGVAYDELGNQSITYIFKNEKDKIYPVSVVVTIDFKIDEVVYKCSSAIQFSNYSNKELKMPVLNER